MLYLYVMRRDNPPTAALLAEVLKVYSQHHGAVKMLGGHAVSRQLPRSPDMYVVTCSFEACRKAGLPVSADIEIAYSLDTFEGETIGVCQIRI